MLFELNNTPDDDQLNKGEGMNIPLDYKFNDGNKIETVLEQVQPNCCIIWRTCTEWNAHDLLIGILMQSGPADVYISSYGFSEHPARIIADLKQRKIIEHLYCVIDKRLDKRSASAYNLVRNCSDKIKLAETHAKVTVIENKKVSIAIMGSANYTSNKRHEAGVIIWHPAAAAFNKKWITDELNKS